MKSNPNLLRRWLSLLVLSPLALVLSVPALSAQTAATGTVQGRVFNPVSKEYVRNAEVRLEGTNRVDYTANDGTFEFDKVRPGSASITITYTGYDTVTESFTVTAGQTAVREINLSSTTAKAGTKDSVIQLSAFTVSTEREGDAKAIMEQRRNMDITTSVSSDIFGDITDGNVGEFLKYLPGVDLDYVESEARGPRLGGMDGQYVGVSFDGMRTASADANRGGGTNSRATSFEGFSITSIESIEINRTTSAESDADSPAGTINMKTKRAFDRKGRRIGINYSLNFNAEEFTLNKTAGPRDGYTYKWKPNLGLEYSESFMNQKLGILLSASHASSYTEQYSHNQTYNRNATAADPRPYVIRQISFKDGNKNIIKDALMLTADYRANRNLVLSMNAIYTYTEGDFWNRNFNFVAANDNANVRNGRSTVGGDGMTTVVATRAPSGSVNNRAQLDNGGGSSAKLTYTRSFSPKFEYKIGSWVIDGAMGYSRSVNNYESLERGHSNSEGGSVPSSWIATRPHKESWEWEIRQTSGADWYDLASFRDTNSRSGGTRVNNDDRTWITTLWNGQLNAKWAIPAMERFPTVLKFGGKWAEEYRDANHHTDWNIWSYVGPGGNTVSYNSLGIPVNTAWGNWSNLGPEFTSPHPFDTGTTNGLTVYNIDGTKGMPPRVSREAIANLFHSNPDQFVHMGTPDNYYNNYIQRKRDFLQTVKAAYLQADVRLTPKLQLRTGLRMENTENRLKEFDPLLASEVNAAGYPTARNGRATTYEGLLYQYTTRPRVNRESDYRNYFPSVLLKYKIQSNFEFQAGFNKAISRAPLDSLSGVWIIDDVNERITAPNPNTPPEHSRNFQARLAYYFSGRSPGQLSLQVSQNDIRNLRETFDFSADEFGVTDPEFSNYIFRTTRISTEERRFRNMELSYRQTMGFLPGAFRGTNLNIAYTRSYASQRRSNLAPHRLTTRLGYAFRKFNGTLGMVYRDRSPDGSVLTRYKDALTQFDLSLSWKFTSRYSMYVQGRNITGKPVLWYESPPGTEMGTDPALRQMQEYGANWVFGVKAVF